MGKCLLGFVLCFAAVMTSASAQNSRQSDIAAQIIALESAALERWLIGDPQGYLDLYLDDVSYFDPRTELRTDGKTNLELLFAPMRSVDSSSTEPRFEIVSPTVRASGDSALLTYNLHTYRKLDPNADHQLVAKWNATELYRRVGNQWKIAHSHWSFTLHQNPIN